MKRVKDSRDLLRNGGKDLKCSKCGEIKERNEKNFYKYDNAVGFKTVCKCCRKKYYKDNRQSKLDYQRDYLAKNRDYYNAYSQIYRVDKIKAREFKLKDFRKIQSELIGVVA